MQNYWLSEYNKKSSDEPQMDDSEDETDDQQDPDEPSSKLNDRQKMMYEHHEMLVEEFGKFDQSAKANGAHYAPGAKNPFVKEGLVCANCVFFMGGHACELVSGKIEPNGICKLWIIPQELIK